MEYEEQKPKDIILNEKEIEKKPVDLLEKVKEEPIEDDGYSDLIIQETKELLEIVKEEPIDEEYIISNGKVKREMDDFLINMKKESTVNEEHSELVIPKQETQELLENVKEEPIEEEYFNQIAPKLEEVMEPSASYMSNNSVQTSFIETKDAEPPRKSLKQIRCSICLQMHPRQNAKFVIMEEDNLVTMVGCVLRGDYTLERAQLFMSSEKRVPICYVHFSESINTIYEVLNIKNNVKITSCTSELMNRLMITVNALNPQIETWKFCDILHNFVRRNISQKRTCSLNGALSKMQQKHRCSVCTQNELRKNMKHVTMEEEKLVIMVGCVLRDDYSFDRAQLFMSAKGIVHICHVHFSEALNKIYEALNIKNPDEVFLCSAELMTNLIITVNKLCPQFDSWQFRTSLNKFFTRNKRFIQIRSDLKL